MAGVLLAPGSFPDSAEIVVTTVETSVCLYVTAGGAIPPFSPAVTVEKKAPGDVYTPIAELTLSAPAINLLSAFGRGTFIVRRGATNVDIGVFYDPVIEAPGSSS